MKNITCLPKATSFCFSFCSDLYLIKMIFLFYFIFFSEQLKETQKMLWFTGVVAGSCNISVTFEELFFNVKMLLNKISLSGSSTTVKLYQKVVICRPVGHAIFEQAYRNG